MFEARGVGHATNEGKLIADRFHRASDILVQAWMARLIYGSLVLLAPHKQVSWIDLTDIQNRMYCHLDCTLATVTLGTLQESVRGLLNSEMPRTASVNERR